jgi:hypothetical protein
LGASFGEAFSQVAEGDEMGNEGVVDGPRAVLTLRTESFSTLLKNSFHKGDTSDGDSLAESSHAFKQESCRFP